MKIIGFIKRYIYRLLIVLNDISRYLIFKKKGISGHMCVRNEIHTVKESIESVVHFVDELIIQYNDCTDGTDLVIKEMAEKYNNIRVFEWKKHPFKMWEYRNYGLKKCKYRWNIKLDADQIYYFPSELREQILSAKRTTLFKYGGICPFIKNKKWMFVNEGYDSIKTLDANGNDIKVTNDSETHFIICRGMFDKYTRIDDKSYCEIFRHMNKNSAIMLGRFMIHFIYCKRKISPSLKYLDTLDNILCLESEIDKNLVSKLKFDHMYNDIMKSFLNSDRGLMWYEQKIEIWNDKIY